MENISLETAIPYVAAAYIGIWVIFFGYLVVLAGKLGNLNKQVQALTDVVKRKSADKSEEAKTNNRG